MDELCRRIRLELDRMDVADVHSHLGSHGIRQARTLADVVSYHWLSTELQRAAGRPFKSDPVRAPEDFVREVVPYFPAIRNTVNHYAFMGILRDLYGIDDRTLTNDNWQRADEAVRAHAKDTSWIATVLDRGRIQKVVFQWNDGRPQGDRPERYVPYDHAEYLYAGESRGAIRTIIGRDAAFPETAEGLKQSIVRRVDALAGDHAVRVLHVWQRGTWVYTATELQAVDGLLKRLISGDALSMDERNALASFTADAAAEAAGRHRMVVQLFHGTIHYTGAGPAGYWNPEFLRSLTLHFEKHPDTRFDLFLSTRLPSHEAATLSRVYPNVMVSGAWWQGFTPTTMLTFFRDRLELLPNTAWNAFFSDGYIVEWIHGKLLVTKNRLAHALAGMVNEEFLTEADTPDVARRLLYDNAAASYGMEMERGS